MMGRTKLKPIKPSTGASDEALSIRLSSASQPLQSMSLPGGALLSDSLGSSVSNENAGLPNAVASPVKVVKSKNRAPPSMETSQSSLASQDAIQEDKNSARSPSSQSQLSDSARSFASNPMGTRGLTPVTAAEAASGASKHSTHRVSGLSVFCGTWNMHGKKPPHYFPGFVPADATHDIYCFGTQESGSSIQASFFIPSKAEWEKRLRGSLGPSYVQIASKTMMAIHIVIYARATIATRITGAQVARVPTGLLGIVGNKGGVACRFLMDNTSFMFVCAHLAAHQSKVDRRNADAHTIEAKLAKQFDVESHPELMDGDIGGSSSGSNLTGSGRTNAWAPLSSGPMASEGFDYVFFLGDLNYRIDSSREDILEKVQEKDWSTLALQDQLLIQRNKGAVLVGFDEGEIGFAPTYKFDANSDTYDTSKKKRRPAWTDRILYKSKHPMDIQLMRYEGVFDLKSSDHRPVVALFNICLRR